MGRRWGKSTLAGAVSLACAARGARVGWVVPTYKNGRPLWRWAEQSVAALKAAKAAIVNKAERTIDLQGGGFLGIFSADNPDSMRGEAFHLIVVDEAARIAEETWTDVLQPTLADHAGRALLISTPKGRNWFYQEWQRGQSPNALVKSWRAPATDNPNPRIRRAAALAKERVPAITYQQEWLAEFVEDGLTLFRLADIERAQFGAIGESGPIGARRYITTVDLGRRCDATVINTFDLWRQPYQRVAFDRLERVPYPLIQQRIEARALLYPGELWVESNGIGDPVIENLNVPAFAFVTTARSKIQALQALQLLFEHERIKARWDSREREALIGCAWDEAHTPDEVMSLAIFASVVQGDGQSWDANNLKALSSGRRV